MTPREWIDQARAAGFWVALTTDPGPKSGPFYIHAGPQGFGESWESLALVLSKLGLEPVTAELRREVGDAS